MRELPSQFLRYQFDKFQGIYNSRSTRFLGGRKVWGKVKSNPIISVCVNQLSIYSVVVHIDEEICKARNSQYQRWMTHLVNHF